MGIQINRNFKNRAINLFAFSQTARSDLGQKVHRFLYDAPDMKFQWLQLPWNEEASTHYRGDEPYSTSVIDVLLSILPNCIRPLMISVNSRFQGNLEITSLQLVHESVHHLKWDEPIVEQELHAYHLAGQYYRELRQGILVRTEDKRYQLIDTYEPQEVAWRKMNTGKLVDWLVQAKHGQKPRLTAKWVVGHIGYWGGIKNRNSFTKAAFLHTIAVDGDYTDAAQNLYLNLFESLPREQKTQFRRNYNNLNYLRNIQKLMNMERSVDARKRQRVQAVMDELQK